MMTMMSIMTMMTKHHDDYDVSAHLFPRTVSICLRVLGSSSMVSLYHLRLGLGSAWTVQVRWSLMVL